MDSNEVDPEVLESHAPDHHPEVGRTVPSAPSPTIEKEDMTDKVEQPDTATRDNHKPLEHGSFDLSDEIQALKAKIIELEQHAKAGPDVPTLEESHPQLTTKMEQYKQMEACLYRHRKEWEKSGGPGPWDMGTGQINDFFPDTDDTNDLSGPWKVDWHIRPTRNYYRPDPFDPSHVCADDQHGAESPFFDDFDHAIDYGARRQRIRKNFEWEMDRLYLAEEIDRRKREKRKEENILDNNQCEEPVKSEEAVEPEEDAQLKKNVQSEVNKKPSPPSIELSRLEWFSFRAARYTSGCGIEVLEGEPVIDDTGSYRSWYGSSGRRAHVTDRSLDRKAPPSTSPDKRPMPERIRIRSHVLLQILRTILGTEQEWSSNILAVLIRPFKAIVYCEQALRDWCSALEKKFQVLPSTKDDAAVEGSSVIPSQGEVAASEDSAGANATAERPSAADSDSQGLVPSPPQQNDHGQDKIVSEQNEDEGYDEGKQGMEKDKDAEDEEDEEDDTKSPMALEHLKCLLRFIDSDISARRTYLDDPSCRKIVFSDLWLLFRPGIEVIGTDGKQAYRVVHTTSAKHRVTPAWQAWLNHSKKQRKDSPFSITCVYIDFDGRDLGPVQRVFDFKKFDGETEIVSLEVYPLRFHPTKESNFNELEWKELKTLPATDRHRQRLINRGAKFLDVASVKHMYYPGPTLEVRDEVESQVVIDFETAFSAGGPTGTAWKPELKPLVGIPALEEDAEDAQDYPCNAECCNRQYVHDDSYVDQKQRDEYVESLLPKGSASDKQPSIAVIPRPLKELRTGYGKHFSVSDDELVIMSYRVFGFVLRSRKWAKLDLSLLTEAHPPDLLSTTTTSRGPHDKMEENVSTTTAFDRLVLEKGHKSMIESLVAQHFRDKQSKTGRREEFDIVRGKGTGLILLLHGAPGVGKTSTAEGVAEIFKKPLFQITCGDLGTTASEVERALETNFSLANRWDCILLLDEADVFLAERSKEDFQRNGLVAVFLRVMEYYAGVLFLTTNRVGDFDEAFTSRIHISLYYPELSRSKTESIFKLNMDMIEERFKQNGRKIKINPFDIGTFATKHFSDHPESRWNGRQIRNACQTALALAEYEAQGNSHAATPRPDVEVELKVEHFEVVRNAYLEFTKYMNDLYGTNAARRAKEARLRAMWLAENDNILGGGKAMDRTAFALASQIHHQQQAQQQQHGFPRAPPSHYHQGVSPQIVHTQTQQEQPYYSYQNPAPQQSNYPERSRMGGSPHNPAPDQYRSNTTGGMAYPSFDGSQQGYDQTYAARQPSPMTTPTRQQEHPTNHPWLRDGIRSMYEPSGDRNPGQAPPGSVSPGPASYTQGNPAWGPPRSQA